MTHNEKKHTFVDGLLSLGSDLKNFSKWVIRLCIGFFVLQYFCIVTGSYIEHSDLFPYFYSDRIRLSGLPDDIAQLKMVFLHEYFFVPLIQGSVFMAAVAKAMGLLYQSLLVPFFKRS